MDITKAQLTAAEEIRREWMRKYMPEDVEYPSDLLVRGLKDGVSYSYVSHRYLEGIVNYTNVMKVFVINRYREGRLHDGLVALADGYPPEAFEQNLGKVAHHPHISAFEDDVLMLCRLTGRKNMADRAFVFFWWDRDVSDCVVGSFQSENMGEVLKDFEVYARAESIVQCHRYRGGFNPRCYEIPVEKLTYGWLSWSE